MLLRNRCVLQRIHMLLQLLVPLVPLRKLFIGLLLLQLFQELLLRKRPIPIWLK